MKLRYGIGGNEEYLCPMCDGRLTRTDGKGSDGLMVWACSRCPFHGSWREIEAEWDSRTPRLID